MEIQIVLALLSMCMFLLAKGRVGPGRPVPAPAKVYGRRTIESQSHAATRRE